MSLIIHAGGHRAGYDEVCAVPLPEKTETYVPVANQEIVEYVRRKIDEMIGLSIRKEEYGLSKEGQQMFGLITLESDSSERCPCIGIRNSYNKSLGLGLAGGLQVCCCDNLVLSGDAFTVFRKHTQNIWNDIESKISAALRNTLQHYSDLSIQLDQMKEIAIDIDRGYEIIGHALGTSVVQPRAANIAIRDWRTPRHEEFSDRNLHSLYQCFTESAKKGLAGQRIDRQIGIHDYFSNLRVGNGRIIDAEIVEPAHV